jgi:hypothetical protein
MEIKIEISGETDNGGGPQSGGAEHEPGTGHRRATEPYTLDPPMRPDSDTPSATTVCDAEARLANIGAVHRAETSVRVVGWSGTALIDGSQADLDQVATFLGSLDGHTCLRDVASQIDVPDAAFVDLVTALLNVQAITDTDTSWRLFHARSSNPQPSHRLSADATAAAYALPRARPAGAAVSLGNTPPFRGTLTELGIKRRSVLAAAACDPQQSTAYASDLAMQTYRLRPAGGRPIASAGMLSPLQLWVASPRGEHVALLAIDHDNDVLLEKRQVTHERLRECFAPDPRVYEALRFGSAVIVISADPTRITLKYGDRGWRYAFIEAGAAMHHILLLATEAGVDARPIGRFIDARLTELLGEPFLPLLTVLISATPI